MKYISKICVLLIMTVATISTVSCQSNSKYATARIIDVSFGFNKPRIIVAYGDKDGEIIPLKEYGTFQDMMTNPNRLDSVMLENQKLVNKFYKDMKIKGYEIKEVEMSVNDGHFTYVVFHKIE